MDLFISFEAISELSAWGPQDGLLGMQRIPFWPGDPTFLVLTSVHGRPQRFQSPVKISLFHWSLKLRVTVENLGIDGLLCD